MHADVLASDIIDNVYALTLDNVKYVPNQLQSCISVSRYTLLYTYVTMYIQLASTQSCDCTWADDEHNAQQFYIQRFTMYRIYPSLV